MSEPERCVDEPSVVCFLNHMDRKTAATAKPLSVAERKSVVMEIAKRAPAEVQRGISLIDFREPDARERAIAETLSDKARRILSRQPKEA